MRTTDVLRLAEAGVVARAALGRALRCATKAPWLPWAGIAATVFVAAAAGSAPGVLGSPLAWVRAVPSGRGTLAGLALVAHPRALMTGDYIALEYAVAAPLPGQLGGRDDGEALRVRLLDESLRPLGSGPFPSGG